MQEQQRNSRNMITPKQDYSIYEFLPHESHQNDMGQNGLQRMRSNLLLRKGSQDMTSELKAAETQNLNRFGNNNNILPLPRMDPNIAGNAMLGGGSFPMSFIDPNQVTNLN